MQKNSQNFSMEEALNLAKSPAGQQLLAMLQNTDGALLQQASSLVSAGDYEAASRILRALLSSPEASKLMDELGG